MRDVLLSPLSPRRRPLSAVPGWLLPGAAALTGCDASPPPHAAPLCRPLLCSLPSSFGTSRHVPVRVPAGSTKPRARSIPSPPPAESPDVAVVSQPSCPGSLPDISSSLQEGDHRWINSIARALQLLSSLYGPFGKAYGIGRCAKVRPTLPGSAGTWGSPSGPRKGYSSQGTKPHQLCGIASP